MRVPGYLLLTLTLAIACATSRGAEPQSRSRTTLGEHGVPVEEVLVTGEHPGPGLWRVSAGDHMLLILGTHSPLPMRMRWRSAEVELAISEAQQVLAPYSASFTMRDGNPLAVEGKPLRKVLPRRAYAQWRAFKHKYIGDVDEVERMLPVTAALVLRSNAYAQSGLTSADAVWKEVSRLAAEYHVPVTDDHQVTKMIASMPSGAAAQRTGVDFLVSTMTTLEEDLRRARAQANAWAVGDIEALLGQATADTSTAQLYASSWPFLTNEELHSLASETDARWLAAAEQALKRNRTTVAVLPIYLLLKPDGLLSVLKARGFDIQAPTD